MRTSPERSGQDIVVDVGIPAYGDAPYISEAVESIIAQSYEAWRLVISEGDSGSERIRAALEPYLDDPRVVHSVVPEKLSQAENWTRVIQFGGNPFVAMLHDDDRWHPDFLNRRVKFLAENPTCGFVFSGHMMVDGRGRVNGQMTLNLPEGILDASAFLTQLYQYNFIGPCTSLVRRQAYEAVGPQFKNMLVLDHEMWLRLASRFAVGFLAVWDSDVRIHDFQTSSVRRLGLGRSHLQVIDETMDIRIPEAVRKRMLFHAHLCIALDEIELARRAHAFNHVRQAVRADVRSLARPGLLARLIVAVISASLGSVGRRLLTRARMRRFVQRSAAIGPRAHQVTI